MTTSQPTDHATPPSTETSWEARFRAAAIFLSQIAPLDPSRGLVSSNRSGVAQLYAWSPCSGELTQLTDEPTGRIIAELSPDGRWACYLRDEGGNELGHLVALPTESGPEIDLTPELAPYAGELVAFSRDGRSIAFVTASDDVFTARVGCFADGRVTDLHAAHSTRAFLGGLSLSSNGAFIVLSSSHRSRGLEFSLLTLDARSGEAGPELWDGEGTSLLVFGCSAAPGDERILATSNRTGPERAFIWDRAGGARLELPDGTPEGDILPLDWSEDGRLVLLCRVHRAEQSLHIWDLEAGGIQSLDLPPGAFLGSLRRGASYFAPGGAELVVRWEDFASPRRLVAVDVASGQITRTILEAGPVPPGATFDSVEIAMSAGEMVQAWLGRPVGEAPYPVILSTHGGPTAATSPNFDAILQAYVDAGFAVLALNYHGSTTFGKDFEQSIWGRLGELELADMAAARTWLIEHGVAREGQVFLEGWSYGGYLTLLGLGRQPGLWAGGMAGVAIADWGMNYEDSTDLLRGYQRMLFNGDPDDPAVAEAFRTGSPLTYVDDVRAPVLIIQGRNDTRTPARPMQRYVERLRGRDHPVEIEWFDAGHTGGAANNELAISHTRRIIDFARAIVDRVPAR